MLLLNPLVGKLVHHKYHLPYLISFFNAQSWNAVSGHCWWVPPFSPSPRCKCKLQHGENGVDMTLLFSLEGGREQCRVCLAFIHSQVRSLKVWFVNEVSVSFLSYHWLSAHLSVGLDSQNVSKRHHSRNEPYDLHKCFSRHKSRTMTADANWHTTSTTLDRIPKLAILRAWETKTENLEPAKKCRH